MTKQTLTPKKKEWLETVEKHFGSRIVTINRKQLAELEKANPTICGASWLLNDRTLLVARGIFTVPWSLLNDSVS